MYHPLIRGTCSQLTLRCCKHRNSSAEAPVTAPRSPVCNAASFWGMIARRLVLRSSRLQSRCCDQRNMLCCPGCSTFALPCLLYMRLLRASHCSQQGATCGGRSALHVQQLQGNDRCCRGREARADIPLSSFRWACFNAPAAKGKGCKLLTGIGRPV